MTTLQEKIKAWQVADVGRTAFHAMYEEVLQQLLQQDEIYTVMSPNAEEAELVQNTANMFCGLNTQDVPSFWLFSELEIAEAFARHYGFEKEGRPLVRHVELDEITLSLYYGMFSGVKEVMIDEGRSYVRATIYDVVNQCFVVQGEEPILDKSDYPILTLLTGMKMNEQPVFATSGDGESIIIVDGDVAIYTKEAELPLPLVDLATHIRQAQQRGATTVTFQDEAFTSTIAIEKLINIFGRMYV